MGRGRLENLQMSRGGDERLLVVPLLELKKPLSTLSSRHRHIYFMWKCV